MGLALAQEIASGRPPKPGPEWWLLLDLALDADDKTRRTACGYEYMAERSQASRPTIYRWLQKLTEAGLITVAQRSRSAGRNGGKGERAVYEIQVPPRVVDRARVALLNGVSSCVRPDSEMGSHKKRPDSAGNEVSSKVRPDSGAESQVRGMGSHAA